MENKNNQVAEVKENILNLISEIEHSSEAGKRIDQVELHIFKTLLQIGKSLVLFYIDLIRSKTEKVQLEDVQNKGITKSSYFSIFGLICYQRNKYYNKKKTNNLSLG